MASRREIREAAVQFLYCADLDDSINNDMLFETFWSVVMESDEIKLLKATAKAILHLNQGRSSRYVKLIDRTDEAKAFIKAESEASSLSELLEKILKNDFRNNWLQAIDDFPNLKKQLEPFTAQISSLNRVGQRILTVEEPESHPDQTDVSHLRESMKKMGEYRESVAKFVTGVLKNKEQIDASIVKVVENFSPERIDPVDRATIRLASYEILFCDSVPPAVAINEAIEIVKKFGSNESSRFTNGILDALVKNIEKTDINIKISD